MFNLHGKVAVVAGGAGYLGAPICRGLAAQGATVIVADLNSPSSETLVQELNRRQPELECAACPLDLREESSIDTLLQRVSAFGRLDILVNATCAPHGSTAAEISVADFTRSLSANVASSFILARQAKSMMPAGGSVIFFSSMYGRVAPDPRAYAAPMSPNPVEYGVAKAGIEQMIRYLAVAWAADGIRVNGIAPGPFPNPQVQKQHPDFISRLAAKVPLGRIGNADEIAGAVVFLASTAASYVTGQTLVVDGGWTAW